MMYLFDKHKARELGLLTDYMMYFRAYGLDINTPHAYLNENNHGRSYRGVLFAIVPGKSKMMSVNALFLTPVVAEEVNLEDWL